MARAARIRRSNCKRAINLPSLPWTQHASERAGLPRGAHRLVIFLDPRSEFCNGSGQQFSPGVQIGLRAACRRGPALQVVVRNGEQRWFGD